MGTVVVILTLALLAEREGVSLVAGRAPAVGTLSVWNALSIRATRVGVAGVGLDLAALNGVRHGDIARQALAHRVPVVVDLTPRVGSTGRGVTGVRGRGADLQPHTAGDCVRLRGVASLTGAHRVPLSVGVALGVRTTRGRVAGVRPRHTLVVAADVALHTVRVRDALPPTPCDRVGLGDVVRKTPTDGVAIVGH